MPDTDDFIHLHATDQTIALDFAWTLSRRCVDGDATVLDYQDAGCRCRIRIDRQALAQAIELAQQGELAQASTPRFRVRRDWLQVLSGAPSPERLDAIIARINRVLRWPA
ncbi:MAG: hypothetical protein AB7V26_14450 [Lysobacterales bacterium]